MELAVDSPNYCTGGFYHSCWMHDIVVYVHLLVVGCYDAAESFECADD